LAFDIATTLSGDLGFLAWLLKEVPLEGKGYRDIA
jgi:hypothetical protein